MAGRFVILYFGDEERAQRYVDTTERNVVGMYEDPKDKVCTCRSQQNSRTRDFGQGPRHNYWGWQKHAGCGKAGTWWRRNIGKRLFLALGVNLLGDKAPKMMQSPAGWGHENYKPQAGEA